MYNPSEGTTRPLYPSSFTARPNIKLAFNNGSTQPQSLPKTRPPPTAPPPATKVTEKKVDAAINTTNDPPTVPIVRIKPPKGPPKRSGCCQINCTGTVSRGVLSLPSGKDTGTWRAEILRAAGRDEEYIKWACAESDVGERKKLFPSLHLCRAHFSAESFDENKRLRKNAVPVNWRVELEQKRQRERVLLENERMRRAVERARKQGGGEELLEKIEAHVPVLNVRLIHGDTDITAKFGNSIKEALGGDEGTSHVVAVVCQKEDCVCPPIGASTGGAKPTDQSNAAIKRPNPGGDTDDEPLKKKGKHDVQVVVKQGKLIFKTQNLVNSANETPNPPKKSKQGNGNGPDGGNHTDVEGQGGNKRPRFLKDLAAANESGWALWLKSITRDPEVESENGDKNTDNSGLPPSRTSQKPAALKPQSATKASSHPHPAKQKSDASKPKSGIQEVKTEPDGGVDKLRTSHESKNPSKPTGKAKDNVPIHGPPGGKNLDRMGQVSHEKPQHRSYPESKIPPRKCPPKTPVVAHPLAPFSPPMPWPSPPSPPPKPEKKKPENVDKTPEISEPPVKNTAKAGANIELASCTYFYSDDSDYEEWVASGLGVEVKSEPENEPSPGIESKREARDGIPTGGSPPDGSHTSPNTGISSSDNGNYEVYFEPNSQPVYVSSRAAAKMGIRNPVIAKSPVLESPVSHPAPPNNGIALFSGLQAVVVDGHVGVNESQEDTKPSEFKPRMKEPKYRMCQHKRPRLTCSECRSGKLPHAT